ncbi:MAG: M23 family peptidase [Alphaproteobacteria bacterium]|nr:M23 family peptidase [Alphaproteobacteria bacterium]
MKFILKSKYRQKVINTCYFSAVMAAFVLSLAHNNRVEASIDNRDYFSYLMIEDSVSQNIDDTQNISEESASGIKAMFEMVDKLVKQRNVEKEVALQSGDTLISLLTRLGASREVANDIYYSLKEHYDPRDLKAGQKLKVNLAIDSQTEELANVNYLMIEPNAGERIITALKNGAFETYVEKDEFIDEINSISGEIDGNLSNVMNRKGVPMRVISNFINIFSYSVDFKRDLQKGDSFEIVYESQVTPDGTLVKSGNILYAGLVLRNQKIALYRFKDSKGNVDYYSAKGQALKKTLDRKPLAARNAHISSPFGKRYHPVLKKHKIHWGVDYAAPSGTPIYAGGDGVVQVAKYNGSYGYYIKIRHNSEFSTAYGHMSRFAKGIRPGVRVTQGQVIAYVGSTGRSTGPHLHYEVIQNGRRVNPRTIKAATGENLSGNNLAKFKKLVAKIDNDFGKAFAERRSVKLAQK